MDNTKPNLVYVFADQLRLKSCGYASDANAKTPNIDRLKSKSVDFCNAVSGHPVCAPYRASLFTGKYTTGTGMVINELRMNPGHRCFGHILHENGYDTAYIGKWHLWANELGNHDDVSNSFVPPGPHRLGFDGYWAAYNFHHEYYDTYYHGDTPEKLPIKGYEPDFQTDLAIGQIAEKAKNDKPFALFLSIGTPHDPWDSSNVPDEYYKMFDDVKFELPDNYSGTNDSHADDWTRLKPRERQNLAEWMRVYYAMTANLDYNVGRLYDAIDELGLLDNTIFVFTSDHGEMFGSHGRRAKNIFYDEAVRVPFLMGWKGRLDEGAECDACLNACDIMPTILSMMDLPVPDSTEGYDFSRVAFGEKDIEEPRFALMQCTGATADWEDGHEWRALRGKRFTYAVYLVDNEEFLFDNLDDPLQQHNLIDSPGYEKISDDFRKSISKKMHEIGDTFEKCTWYRDNWIKDRVILKSSTM